MEKMDESFHLFKKTSLNLLLVIVFGSLLSLGVFQIIQYIGWPETVKWFFAAFIWIFAILLGLFNVVERMQTDGPAR